MFRSGEFPTDWHQPAVLKGLEWRWSLETPWGWETGAPIRLPGLLLDGERVTCLRPFRPADYDAAWREYDLSEYFAVRAELVGERVCPQCLKPIAADAHEARRYCSDTCKQRASILHRAAELLMGLSDEKVIKILRQEQMKPQVNPAPSAEDLAKFRESHSNISFEDTHRADENPTQSKTKLTRDV